MNNRNTFFKYVIPSIIAFALSGIYAIVDGYFVGNTIGDAGLSAINIAYPIVALIQAVGIGLIPFIRNFESSNFTMYATEKAFYNSNEFVFNKNSYTLITDKIDFQLLFYRFCIFPLFNNSQISNIHMKASHS